MFTIVTPSWSKKMRAIEVLFTLLEEAHVAQLASKTIARCSAGIFIANLGWATSADQAASRMSCCSEINRSQDQSTSVDAAVACLNRLMAPKTEGNLNSL